MENHENGGQGEQAVTVNTGKVLAAYRLSPSNDSEFKRRAKQRNVTQDQLLAHLLRVDSPDGEQQEAAPLPPQLSAIDEALSIIREQARALFVAFTGQNETLQRGLDAERVEKKDLESKCMQAQREVEKMADDLARTTEERDILIQQAHDEAASRASIETELAEARDIITQLTAEGERLETDLGERDAEIATTGRERDALTVRLAEAEREIARLRTEAVEERRTLESVRLELARTSILAAETTDLRAELGTGKHEIETLKEKTIRLESAVEFERQTTVSLKDRISHLEKTEASIRQMFESERTRAGENLDRIRDELALAREDRVKLETTMTSEKKLRECIEQERTGLQETIRSLRLEVQKREVEEAVRAATRKKIPATG